MGGNALESGPSIRLNKEEYFNFTNDLNEKLKSLVSYNFKLVPAYARKESFGDADYVFCINSGIYSVEEISNCIGAVEFSKNGNCTSFGIQLDNGIFQVDFIQVETYEFNFALRYFSYNDLGNLIGRIAHKAHFKFGWNGLNYVIRDSKNDTRVVAELNVTNDWNKALKFLGYVPSDIAPDSLEDVFKYAVSSPYSNRDIYLLENRNNAARTRDRKRVSYNSFLRWLETSDYDLPKFDWTEKDKLRKHFLEEAFELFPNFHQSYKEAIRKNDIFYANKLKYSGEIVNKLTGLINKDLGDFMAKFRKDIEINDKSNNSDTFLNYINNLTTEQIKEKILKQYNDR